VTSDLDVADDRQRFVWTFSVDTDVALTYYTSAALATSTTECRPRLRIDVRPTALTVPRHLADLCVPAASPVSFYSLRSSHLFIQSRDKQPHQHPTTLFFTGRVPSLSPSQQRQSTEGFYPHFRCGVISTRIMDFLKLVRDVKSTVSAGISLDTFIYSKSHTIFFPLARVAKKALDR